MKKLISAGFVLFMLFTLLISGGVLAVAQDPFDCKLDGDFVIPMSRGEIVRSDKTLDDSFLGPFFQDIPAGTYRITLASFDDHDESDSTQPNESWHLYLSSGHITANISDLPDEDRFITEVVESGFVISSDITSVIARHAVYPDKSSPNSVVPLCASFTLIQEPTATVLPPTATLIPPTRTEFTPTSTLGPTVTATVEPTETPKPATPTNDPIPTYCNPDTGTCTTGGAG